LLFLWTVAIFPWYNVLFIFMLSLIFCDRVVLWSGCKSVQGSFFYWLFISVLLLEIQSIGKGWDPIINQFNPATFLCMFQVRIWFLMVYCVRQEVVVHFVDICWNLDHIDCKITILDTNFKIFLLYMGIIYECGAITLYNMLTANVQKHTNLLINDISQIINLFTEY